MFLFTIVLTLSDLKINEASLAQYLPRSPRIEKAPNFLGFININIQLSKFLLHFYSVDFLRL